VKGEMKVKQRRKQTYPNLSLAADLLFNLFDANVFFAVVACCPHGV
jgi:hypothetical protein